MAKGDAVRRGTIIHQMIELKLKGWKLVSSGHYTTADGRRCNIRFALVPPDDMQGELLDLWAMASADEKFEKTGTACSVCGEPQYKTPSGAVCQNGHGGAPPKT
jgi:hypothetical protein